MSKPVPVLAMRRRQRISGEQFLVGVVDHDLVLPAGAELHLRRLRPDGGDGPDDSPTHCLVVIPPTAAVTKRQLAAAARDRLDGTALRLDPRDQQARAARA